MTTRIAMWCCPRTCSTALLRSFVNRADTVGVDEPLYAYFLRKSGRQHPMREECLASQSQDWREVVEQVLLADVDAPIHYQKHMTHHLDEEIDLGFAEGMVNLFLLRDPVEMLPSLQARIGEVEVSDTGLLQARALYRRLKDAGLPVAAVDSRDILDAPEPTLRAVCAFAGIDFDPAMLSWQPGRHPAFGVWAEEWYKSVEQTTGFRPFLPKSTPFPDALRPILDAVMPAYEELHALRLQPEVDA